MMTIVVQWATILSPIIALLIAWWMSYSSKKDTAKKIAALEESTQKQVESLKKMLKLQADIATLKLDMDLWDTHFRLHELSGQKGNVLEDNRNIRKEINEAIVEDMTEEEIDSYNKKVYYNNQLSSLEGHIRRLEEIKKGMGL